MDDLISRQAAIDVLDRNHILGQGLLNDTLDHIADAIMALPSAQPDLSEFCDRLWKAAYERGKAEAQRTGKWIYNSPVTMKCNQCGFVIKDWDWYRFKHCPNCGAKMEERRTDGTEQS